MIADKGCAERGCACYDDRVDKNGVEMVELKPDHFCFVVDENGNMVEFYMPNKSDDEIVPNKIVKVMNILLEDKE